MALDPHIPLTDLVALIRQKRLSPVELHPTEIAGRPIRIHDAFPFTHPFNLTGHPALSLPAGMTDAGLPAAIQFVGRRFREDLLLRLGRQFEQARPWPLAPDRYR
jgi:Asp-tRNA(Asn)/Glu-tRNA(Gln) amidotransferase A subunit family amidase